MDELWGGVTRLDQILLCKPWSHHVRVQAAKHELAEVHDRSGNLEGKKAQLDIDGVEAFEGAKHRITTSDEVMADESIADLIAE